MKTFHKIVSSFFLILVSLLAFVLAFIELRALFAGDYLLMNSENIEINHLELNGNYFLDGAKNIVVRDSVLNSKDSHH